MGLARRAAETALELNNRKDLNGVLSLYEPDARVTLPPGNEITPEELGKIVGGIWDRFPDWHYEIFNLVEDGLTAAYEGSEGGTSPDGSSVSVRMAVFLTVNPSGKIVRVAGYW